MRRMLQFKKTDTGYACFENGENVFEIAKCMSDDKDGRRVYDCIVLLMSKIKEKLAELPPEDSDETSPEDDDHTED